MNTKKISAARRYLEEITGGPLTLSRLIYAIRMCEEESQVEFARRLGISKSQLCDIEKARKNVSPLRAEEFARLLGYSEEQFVRLALEHEISILKGNYRISLEKEAA